MALKGIGRVNDFSTLTPPLVEGDDYFQAMVPHRQNSNPEMKAAVPPPTVPNRSFSFPKLMPTMEGTTSDHHKIYTPFKFLLVDDNVINLRILHKILMKLYPNASITTVDKSYEIPSLLQRQKFDVIFLDIDMPILTGIDIAKIIRKDLDDVAIIAVTTRASTDDCKLYYSLGIDYTLAKPLNYTLNHIVSCVESVIKYRKAWI